ncbi:hypothetical protein V1477_015449 [Vespula maculifrons]|uniref:Uncharacterized protein n=1 Tax=Vespula maculifrons TaxID=7453 RepID=A0ABD2BFU7_VESMC
MGEEEKEEEEEEEEEEDEDEDEDEEVEVLEVVEEGTSYTHRILSRSREFLGFDEISKFLYFPKEESKSQRISNVSSVIDCVHSRKLNSKLDVRPGRFFDVVLIKASFSA